MLVNASPIEWVQTIAALCGAAFSVWGVWSATKQMLWFRSEGINGQRMFWVRSRVRQELMRLTGQGVLVGVGIATLLLPPTDLNLQGYIKSWGLLSVATLFALKTIFERLDRERMEHYPWDGTDRRRESSGSSSG